MKGTIVGVVLVAAGVAGVQAVGAPFRIHSRADSSLPGYEVVTGTADFVPGATTGRHSHPGEMVAYVVEGSLVIEQDGKPAMTVGAGRSVIIPAGVVHNDTNAGRTQARMVATYVIPKGRDIRANPPQR